MAEQRPPAAAGRILALDVGSKTIGLAVTDELGITAQGLETIRRRNKRYDLAALNSVLRRYGVGEIVVGLPLRLSGKAGIQAENVTSFARQLEEKFKLPVRLWDERLTSVEANRILRDSEISIRKRAGAVDRLAAVLILQNYLDYRSAKLSRLTTAEADALQAPAGKDH
jgi:putative Holliday junction resolvase